MHLIGRWLVGVTGVVVGGAGALAQPCETLWREVGVPDSVISVVAYDEARSKAVVAATLDRSQNSGTWVWDGSAWSRRAQYPASSDFRVYGGSRSSAAYDPVRGRIVAYSPTGTPLTYPTYEWDGLRWEQKATTGLSASSLLAYDPVGQRVIAHARSSSGASTRAWNGTAWTTLTTQSTGSPTGFMLETDRVRERVVLLTLGTSTGVHDTWEWDGTSWLQRATAFPAPLFTYRGSVYDVARGKVVAFGHDSGAAAPPLKAWEWNGSAWGEVVPSGSAPMPAPTGMFGYLHAFFDAAANRTVVLVPKADALPEMWAWNGEWTLLRGSPPKGRHEHAMASDTLRGKAWMFGGVAFPPGQTSGFTPQNDLWSFDGAAWTKLFQGGPSARAFHAMAYDSSRDRLVLFGGNTQAVGGGTRLSDTWEWDGTAWTQVATTGPAPRDRHCMAYDPVRRRTVVFGGAGLNSSQRNQTWEWDGATWTVIEGGATGPGHREYSAMGWDPTRQKLILTGYNGGTWSWDGVAWTLESGVGISDFVYGIFHDAGLGEVVALLDGSLRAWEGQRWAGLGLGNPTYRQTPGAAWLSDTSEIVRFGGWGGGLHGYDTWLAKPSIASRFVSSPTEVASCPTGTATFTVEVEGPQPFNYQWRKHDFVTHVDVPVPGATQPTFTIQHPSLAEAGTYSCLVTTACAVLGSSSARLLVCPADLDNGSGLGGCDGGVSVDDLIFFLVKFEAGDAIVDLDNGTATGARDGAVDVDDLLFFLARFEGGC